MSPKLIKVSSFLLTTLLIISSPLLSTSARLIVSEPIGRINDEGIGPEIFRPDIGIPELGGGLGFGSGGPEGGYSRHRVYRPTVVCKENGPCLNMKLRCPAKCFTSYSSAGKRYGEGGGGGGCTMDCKKRCVAYC
ncbi:hypothetical protein LINPERPRIM_LOCUS34043 [Linum perenne]